MFSWGNQINTNRFHVWIYYLTFHNSDLWLAMSLVVSQTHQLLSGHQSTIHHAPTIITRVPCSIVHHITKYLRHSETTFPFQPASIMFITIFWMSQSVTNIWIFECFQKNILLHIFVCIRANFLQAWVCFWSFSVFVPKVLVFVLGFLVRQCKWAARQLGDHPLAADSSAVKAVFSVSHFFHPLPTFSTSTN